MARAALARAAKLGGRPTLKEADARMTRLLDIARRHFLAAGYRETSIDGITREAGIAKKTLYHHFGGKAGLFTAIIETLRRSWIAELRDIVLVPRRPELVLEAVALHLLEVGTRREMIELHRLFMVEAHRFPDLARGKYAQEGSPWGYETPLSHLRAVGA